MRFESVRAFRRAVASACAAFAIAALAGEAAAAPVLTIEMLTWHIVGLDSNNPVLQGPNEFLSGARVCNTGPDTANNITANYVFDTSNPYINISPRGTSTLSSPFILPGDCEDFYFLIRVTRTPLAYNTTRRFHISVSADNHSTISTPTPRELYVEKLISQNRNDVLSVLGPSSVYIGQVVEYTVHSKTATQGYEQLSSFLDFPNLLFQIESVTAGYSSPPSGVNDTVYADACGWDDAIGPTPPGGTYRSCKGPANYTGAKAGGLVDTVYRVKFLSAGSSSVHETIYDFSGSSFHYNADVGIDNINISVNEPTADLQFNKHCSPSPTVPGGTITCLIEYGNNGSTTYTGVEINETYDPRTTYVSAVPAPDSGNNHWDIGTLAPGDYGVISITLTVDATANDGDVLRNRATINDDVAAANDNEGDPPGAFRSAEFDIPVAEQVAGTALLRVTKTGLPDPEVGAGSNITYTINYQNLGPATSYSTVLTDVLGDGLTFVSSTPAPATSSAPTYTWNLGNLASGASGSISVTVKTDATLSSATIVENDVMLVGQPGAGTADTAGLVAYAEEVQFVRGGAFAVADLSITKGDTVDPIAQGLEQTYSFTVTNNGPDVATNVVVTDVLDADTTYTHSSADCTEGPAGTLTCDLGDLAVGASTTFTISAMVNASAPTAGTLTTSPCTGAEDICNNATVDSDQNDSNTANNSSDEPTNVTAVASVCDMSVDKTDLTEPVSAGGTQTYAITVTNNGPNNASDVIIRDELDPNTTYVSDTFPSACTVTGNVVECHYSSLPAGQSRTRNIVVNVAAGAPTAGSKTTSPCDGTEDLCNRVVSVTTTGCKDSNMANNESDEPSNVPRPSSNLSITKTDSPDPVQQGANVVYTINVGNAGPAVATDVVVTDILDTNTTYVSNTAPGGCVEAPTGTLTCSVGTLAVSGSSSFTITALVKNTAPTAGTTSAGSTTACSLAGVDICNRATVSSFNDDATPGNNTYQQPTNVTAVTADLSLTKTDAGYDPIDEGDVFTYTMSVTNNGPNSANNVTVTDVLDANQYYLADDAPGGCVEAPAGTVTCSVGTVANGATTSFSLIVFAPSGGSTAGTLQADPCDSSEDLCNNATVSSSTPDPTPANNSDDEPTDVTEATADLEITKTDVSDPVSLGGVVTYTIHVENPGPHDAQDVVVTDILDSNTTYLSDDFGCVEGPVGTLTCDIGAMLVGQFYDIEVTAQVSGSAPVAGTLMTGACDGSEDVCNAASIASSTTDPDPSNNSDDEPTNIVNEAADLEVTKSDAGFDPVSQGGTVTYTIQVTNNGPDDASSVVVTDVLDANTTHVSNTGGCTNASGTLTCNLGNLTAGNSTSFTVTTSVSGSAPSGGSLSAGACNGSEDLCNTVSVASATPDPTPGNDSDDEPTDVLAPADLEIEKVAPASIVPGQNAVFTITVRNLGAGSAADVSVADPTPSGLTFVSNAGACTTAFPCALGTLAFGESRTITTTYSVPVSYTTPDPVQNTATVSSSSGETSLANNSDTASAPVVPEADVAVTKTAPASVVPGTNAVFTVVVTNNGPSNAANVSVADATPAGLTFISNAGDCTTGYPCSLGTLAPGATRTITTTYSVPASYTTPDPVENTATVSTTTTDPVAANNTSTASAPVAASADMAVVKTAPAAIVPGQNAVFTVTVTNNGSSDAANVSVADATPSGLTFVSNAGDCTTAYPCSLGTVAAGATRTITTTYSVPASYTTPNPVQNTATVSTTTTDPVAANNSSTASAPVTALADVSVVKTGPATVVPGSNAVFTIVVTNLGPSNASAVSVADPTPSGLGFVSNAGDCTTSFPCSLGTLAPGATRTITTTFSVPASYTTPDPLLNTATVSTTTTDPVAANNTSTSSTPVVPSANLRIVKTAPATIVPGQNAVYTLTVTNLGVSDAQNVTVSDPTPTGFTFSSNAGDCTSTFPCSLGTVPAGATRTITTTFNVPASYTTPNPALNTATVSSTTTDPVPANNTSTTSTPVVPSADLSIVKAGPGAVKPGKQLVFTILVTNNGASDAQNVTVADPTPPGLTFVSNAGHCTTAFPCSLGTVPSGATRTITATYSVPQPYTAPNPIQNTATVSSTTSDPVPGNNSDTEPTALSPVEVDLAIQKTGPVEAVPGTNVVFTTVVSNTIGPDTAYATNVTVTDPTPGGLTFVSNSGDCTTAFPCSLGQINFGETRTITSTYFVPSSYLTPDPLLNTAIVSGSESDPDPSNSTSTASVPVVPRADLAIVKTPPALVVRGTGSIWTITVTNNGPSDARLVSVADPTPTGMSFVSNSGACATPYPCSLATIAAGQTRTITTTLMAPLGYRSPDPVVNTATVSSATDDPDSSNNSSVAESRIAKNDLALTKTSSGVFQSCGTASYVLQVENRGDLPSAGTVTVTDVLPTGVSYVGATGSGWTCSATGQAVTCTRTTPVAAGANAPPIVLSVALAAEAYPTVTNTATVTLANDDRPTNDSDTENSTVRRGENCGGGTDPGSCAVSLRKVHSGNDNPGGEIQYTLQWSNACNDDLTDVTITDPMPTGLLLLSASSSDATAQVSGNTATFHVASFRSGSVGRGFITARIDPDAVTGQTIRNVATLSDGDGNSADATNRFRVRGGSVESGSLSCALRAQVFARPGRYVKYEGRYKNGSESNSFLLTMPDDVEILSVYPEPTSRDGNEIFWSSLARTAGKVTVNSIVSLTAEDETLLPSSGVIDDGNGNTAVCEHVGVVDREARLFTSIKAQSISRPGSSMRYTARYRDAVGSNRLVVSLPNEVTIVRAVPAPSGGTERTLIWNDLPVPSGAVKIDVVVGSTVPNGTVLVGSVSMTDESTDVVGAEHQTTIGSTSTTSGGSGGLALTLSALRSVSAGTTTDVTLRYEGLQGTGEIAVELPSELTPVVTTPSASVSGNTVTWTGLTAASGSAKVRVEVDADAAPGKSLLVRGSALDSSGQTATGQASTVVREDSTSSGGSGLVLSLSVPRTVSKGLTSAISADYDGMAGTGQVSISLPSQMTVQSTVPSGGVVSGGQVTWSGLTSPAGSVRANVLVSNLATTGATLSVGSAASDSSGQSATAAGTTSVR